VTSSILKSLALCSRQRRISLGLAAVIAVSIPIVMRLEPKCSPQLPIAGAIAFVLCIRAARGYTLRTRRQ
jgi:hypothetical protein